MMHGGHPEAYLTGAAMDGMRARARAPCVNGKSLCGAELPSTWRRVYHASRYTLRGGAKRGAEWGRSRGKTGNEGPLNTTRLGLLFSPERAPRQRLSLGTKVGLASQRRRRSWSYRRVRGVLHSLSLPLVWASMGSMKQPRGSGSARHAGQGKCYAYS